MSSIPERHTKYDVLLKIRTFYFGQVEMRNCLLQSAQNASPFHLKRQKCTIAHCLAFHKAKTEALHESINSKGRMKMMIVKRENATPSQLKV